MIYLTILPYKSKVASGYFDNDTSNPKNKIFVKHGNSKLLKGVDRSYIAGSVLVYEDSQTFLNYTLDENLVTIQWRLPISLW